MRGARQHPEPLRPGGAAPVTILAVDDVEVNLFALEQLLQSPDRRIVRARSGEEALEVLLREPVALALIDVQMPGMDGFELARLMRGSQRTSAVPIIFLTAAESDVRRTFRGYEAGAVDFMHKPLVPEVLRSKVQVFVQLARQQALLERQLGQLQEALRVNELFTAALGHDLRQPLQAIMMGLLALERAAASEEHRAMAGRLSASGQRMSRMIEQLLDVARMRAESFRLERGAVDLLRVLEQVLSEHPAARSRVRIETKGDCRGHWDATRLEQVMSNLVVNALQHSPGEASVTVRLDGESSGELRCTVANAGAIPGEVLPHIFEPFRTTREDTGGVGLGLYIVKCLVEAHGGEVTVSSRVPEGTAFRFRLPRQAGVAPPGVPSGASPEPAFGQS